MFPKTDDATIRENYARAKDAYAAFGVDTDAAMKRMARIPISINSWQGDDVRGFEVKPEGLDRGGIMATGNYPGRATNADELRSDLDEVSSLIPGPARVNLHASYAETGGKRVERTELAEEHFSRWIDWARDRGYGLDFNPTFFAHPKAESGYTLASPDEGIRRFWIEHGAVSRRIAAAMGRAVGSPCVNNVWLPDGAKDHPMDRWTPRARLRQSLDEMFAEDLGADIVDSLEGKLFGLGSEDYVVGSHEFYLSYCVRNNKVLCLDMGHFHPTETIADKLSAVLGFLDEILLHVSRGVRWDSDHVVILNDDLRELCHETVRGDAIDRVHFGLDFFDASINRLGAWVIGTRSFQRALLNALLEPTDMLRQLETEGNGAAKLAILQETKVLPLGAAWDQYCLTHNVAAGAAWLDEIARYEEDVLCKR